MSNRLVREFIKDALYKKGKGYFDIHDPIISPPGAIYFNKIKGKHEYKNIVQNLYKDAPQHWMTPVEIFQPHYSRALMRYILNSYTRRNKNEELIIYEIGAGNGTNAKNILDSIKPMSKLYEKTKYKSIEISPTLAERQERYLQKYHPKNFEVINKDIADWNIVETAPCFILALEVLDNMPHDKIIFNTSDPENTIFETKVELKEGKLIEKYEKVTDELIKELLSLKPELLQVDSVEEKQSFFSAINDILNQDKSKERRLFENRPTFSEFEHVFIPTSCFNVLKTINKYFLNSSILMSDFDFLPIPNLTKAEFKEKDDLRQYGQLKGCKNFPLVASASTDYASYLIETGNVDIFFPTDFQLLNELFLKSNLKKKVSSRVYKPIDFLSEFGDLSKTKTRTGFNPIIEEFTNTSFFTGTSYED